jgi:MFS family permease
MHEEKNSVHRLENQNDPHQEIHSQGYALESEELPRGYYTTPAFIGTFFAIGMNLASSTAGFALVAPVLGQIDVALGPSASITWLAYVYTICLAIGLLLVGRLSDIFGRRWFFVVGTFLGVIGGIVGATAKTIPVLIGGQTLIGLSACTGYSYAFVVGEIVPVKYRFLANAVVFLFSLPTAGFGAAVSEALILYTEPGWRWVYYLLIILNGVACALYAIFYFPPTFEEKHDGKLMEWIKNFDYVGMVCKQSNQLLSLKLIRFQVLFTGGLILFILGLSSGGSLYPWKSAHVISFIVVGLLCLIALFGELTALFFLFYHSNAKTRTVYETFVDLKEPLIPMHLFRDRGYVASMLSLSIGASVSSISSVLGYKTQF